MIKIVRNQRGITPILIIFIVALVIGSFFIYQQQKIVNTPSTQTVNSTPVATGNLTLEPKITDLIHFKLPAGWIQKVTNPDRSEFAGTIQITSPDLTDSCCGGPKTNAISIQIETKLNGKTMTQEKVYQGLYDEIHDPNPGGAVSHDLTKTLVAGYPAVSSYYDFEGHTHTYRVWNGDYLWTIEIGAPSDSEEEKHKKDINSIISSIQFIPK